MCAIGHARFYLANISTLKQNIANLTSEMDPAWPKTLIGISNSILFTLALTMFCPDTVELFAETVAAFQLLL